VLLDVWSESNLNFVIVGVTGSGKSMMTKVYLKRLRELDNKILYVGVDPSQSTRVQQGYWGHRQRRYIGARGSDQISSSSSKAGPRLGQVADIVSEV
jgi:putative protein kinase ArgK-like GTPase of G3E family